MSLSFFAEKLKLMNLSSAQKTVHFIIRNILCWVLLKIALVSAQMLKMTFVILELKLHKSLFRASKNTNSVF